MMVLSLLFLYDHLYGLGGAFLRADSAAFAVRIIDTVVLSLRKCTTIRTENGTEAAAGADLKIQNGPIGSPRACSVGS
jgi:hypothetical protein